MILYRTKVYTFFCGYELSSYAQDTQKSLHGLLRSSCPMVVRPCCTLCVCSALRAGDKTQPHFVFGSSSGIREGVVFQVSPTETTMGLSS